MPAKQVIVIVAGHRSHGDPGDPTEKSLTPTLAVAYVAALRAAGHEVHYVQQEDGDGDLDDTAGGLDTVGGKTRELCERHGATVMLDLHFEGGGAGGVFAIVPDAAGLTSAIAGDFSRDLWADNPRDRALAQAISRRISEATGIPIRRTWVREPGVMSETQTGVAGRYGARLAMFAYTAPLQEQTVRLVVEHGALDTQPDRSIILRQDFAGRAAAAAVLAVADVFGAPSPSDHQAKPVEPTSRFAAPGAIPKDAERDGRVGGTVFLACRRRYVPTAETPCLEYATPDARPTRNPLGNGEAFEGVWVIEGDPYHGDERWVVTRFGSRIPMATLRPKVRIET